MMNLIVLHGPPGAGKLTVARQIQEMTGYAVFHNHLVVDPLLELFDYGTPEFIRLQERLWLEILEESSRVGKSLIFTFAPGPTVLQGFPQRLAARVSENGAKVYFVALELSLEEQERRIEMPERQQFNKLSSISKLRHERRSGLDSIEVPPSDLTISTEGTPPREVALKICAALNLPRQTKSDL